jgi:NADH-quinone oxidoreductase subunit D
MISGLRMNHAYIRPGGVAQDLPAGAIQAIRDDSRVAQGIPSSSCSCNENPILKGRMVGVGHLDLTGCMALGITGPMLRSAGYPLDLRKSAALLRLREVRLRGASPALGPTPTTGCGCASRRCGSR